MMGSCVCIVLMWFWRFLLKMMILVFELSRMCLSFGLI